MNHFIAEGVRATPDSVWVSRMRISYGVALCVMMLMGTMWLIYNASYVPEYGDTTEYIARSKTLLVDQYRTIFYPLLLRLCGILRDGNSTPSIFWIYLVQVLVSVISSGIYATAAFNLFAIPASPIKMSLSVVALATALVATNPLAAHFSLSIMSDSLASSLTVATVGAMAHLVRSADKPFGEIRGGWLPLAALCLFLMGLSRVDKLYLGFVQAFTMIVCIRISLPRLSHARLAVIILFLTAALVSAASINRFTQVPNPERPALDLSNMAFNRVVWPRLSEVYPYLPSDVRVLIGPEKAKWFDEHNNHVYLLLEQLKDHPENKRIVNEITKTTWQRFPLQVAGKTVFDITKYAIPNLAFPLELVSFLPESVATDWTYTRMSRPYPFMTRAWLTTSTLGFYLLELPIAIVFLRRRRLKEWGLRPLVLLTLTSIGCNAVMFGLEAGMDAHIRYALPSFFMILMLVTVPSLLWLFGYGKKEFHAEESREEINSDTPKTS